MALFRTKTRGILAIFQAAIEDCGLNFVTQVLSLKLAFPVSTKSEKFNQTSRKSEYRNNNNNKILAHWPTRILPK